MLLLTQLKCYVYRTYIKYLRLHAFKIKTIYYYIIMTFRIIKPNIILIEKNSLDEIIGCYNCVNLQISF